MARNVGESVLAKLKNLSREQGVEPAALATRYALERLLYRISLVEAARGVSLKGGLLMSVYHGGDLLRPTRDLDLNLPSADGGADGAAETVVALVREAAAVAVEPDDGVVFDVANLKGKREREGLVPSAKLSLWARIHTARVPVEVDAGFGNAVTPEARPAEVPTLLARDFPRPTLPAYPLESVVSEKTHAMVQHGLLNTRHKDYYDIWRLISRLALRGDTLVAAMRNTFERQGRAIPAGTPSGLSDEFGAANELPWRAFLRKAGAGDAPSYLEVVRQVRGFLLPVLEAARGDAPEPGDWEPETGWSGPEPAPAPAP